MLNALYLTKSRENYFIPMKAAEIINCGSSSQLLGGGNPNPACLCSVFIFGGEFSHCCTAAVMLSSAPENLQAIPSLQFWPLAESYLATEYQLAEENQ